MFGRRLRHFRRRAGLTLEEVGARLGRPISALSLIENGKREPRLTQMTQLADAVGVTPDVLLDPEPPTRRDALELELERRQRHPGFAATGLPEVRLTTGVPDEILERIVAMHRLIDQPVALSGPAADLRRASAATAAWLTDRGGYLVEVESVASDALEAIGYEGSGPVASADLAAIAAWTGFHIATAAEIPRHIRSVVDRRRRRVYVAHRNELRNRQAHKAILQTLATVLLDHEPPEDAETLLRQRIETAYLAGAVLAPERSTVALLSEARDRRDLSIDDLEERYSISYEMAAWRTANLATRHLDMPTHVVVSHADGLAWKTYGNDGVPFPTDPAGSVVAQRLCRQWAARMVFESPDRFGTHAQYTDTPAGTFFCLSHVDVERTSDFSVTFGVPFDKSPWFRHRGTARRTESGCPDRECCRRPPPDLASRWEGQVSVWARSQERLVGLLAPDPQVAVDLTSIYEMLDNRA